eukprot:4655470-Prymnesium_polylepis.1
MQLAREKERAARDVTVLLASCSSVLFHTLGLACRLLHGDTRDRIGSGPRRGSDVQRGTLSRLRETRRGAGDAARGRRAGPGRRAGAA